MIFLNPIVVILEAAIHLNTEFPSNLTSHLLSELSNFLTYLTYSSTVHILFTLLPKCRIDIFNLLNTQESQEWGGIPPEFFCLVIPISPTTSSRDD